MARSKTLIATGFLASASFIAGCQEPQQPTSPAIQRIDVQSPDDYERLWQAIGDTLRDHYFELDRQDRIEGIITTFPETSAAWFELWRPQPSPEYYWWESNLHAVQRKATVNLRPVEDPMQYDVDVQVDRFRYSLEERQIDNPAGALRLYSGVAPTVSGARTPPEESSHWMHLGRDGNLEERLLASIVSRYDELLTMPLEPVPEHCPTTQPQAASTQPD